MVLVLSWKNILTRTQVWTGYSLLWLSALPSHALFAKMGKRLCCPLLVWNIDSRLTFPAALLIIPFMVMWARVINWEILWPICRLFFRLSVIAVPQISRVWEKVAESRRVQQRSQQLQQSEQTPKEETTMVRCFAQFTHLSRYRGKEPLSY